MPWLVLAACGSHPPAPHPAAPPPPKVVTLAILPAESDAFPSAAKAATDSLAQAHVNGIDCTQVSSVSLEVVQLSIECVEASTACYQVVGRTLGANFLLFARDRAGPEEEAAARHGVAVRCGARRAAEDRRGGLHHREGGDEQDRRPRHRGDAVTKKSPDEEASVVELDAMDVAEWEQDQHTPVASDEKLADLVKQTTEGPPAAPRTSTRAGASAGATSANTVVRQPTATAAPATNTPAQRPLPSPTPVRKDATPKPAPTPARTDATPKPAPTPARTDATPKPAPAAGAAPTARPNTIARPSSAGAGSSGASKPVTKGDPTPVPARRPRPRPECLPRDP